MPLKTIFLSHVLSNETVGYGGKKDFISKPVQSISDGQTCNQSEWQLNNHIGTHIDAPFHFSDAGKTIDAFDAGFWVFKSPQLCVIKAEASSLIAVGDWCESILPSTDLLILKTGFESKRDSSDYWMHNPGLSPELGHWLRTSRPHLRAIGFDFISITSYDHRAVGKIAHNAFLHEDQPGQPLLAIEDMHLVHLEKSPQRVVVAPVRVKNSDGSPVTVIAEV